MLWNKKANGDALLSLERRVEALERGRYERTRAMHLGYPDKYPLGDVIREILNHLRLEIVPERTETTEWHLAKRGKGKK